MADTRTCGPVTFAEDSLRARADNLEQWRTLPGVLADLAQLQRIFDEVADNLEQWRTLPTYLRTWYNCSGFFTRYSGQS
jgi:hypothetical protein